MFGGNWELGLLTCCSKQVSPEQDCAPKFEFTQGRQELQRAGEISMTGGSLRQVFDGCSFLDKV